MEKNAEVLGELVKIALDGNQRKPLIDLSPLISTVRRMWTNPEETGRRTAERGGLFNRAAGAGYLGLHPTTAFNKPAPTPRPKNLATIRLRGYNPAPENLATIRLHGYNPPRAIAAKTPAVAPEKKLSGFGPFLPKATPKPATPAFKGKKLLEMTPERVKQIQAILAGAR